MLNEVTEFSSRDAGYANVPAKCFNPPALRKIITANPEMESIFTQVRKVSKSGSTVLILGESGTGKELIARAIHEMSERKGHFVPVNCGAIPDNLLESELFGYEKGAFTGASSSKMGRFVLADGGTIFLDEIGEMSPHLQVKLLRVLQDKVVESVGGLKPKKVDVRIVAATNVNLRELVEKGEFREDLFYRLQVVPIQLPSLRERGRDIEILSNHFSKKFSELNNRRGLVFSPEVLAIFSAYSWPGNVRELENLIQRLAIMVDGDAVYPSDLPEHLIAEGDTNLCNVLSTDIPQEGLDFNAVIEGIEKQLIVQALERTGGNKKAAAELLSLNRTTLVEKIKKKGIDRGIGKETSRSISEV